MELWAQFAHKALWHDFEPGWKLHKSHHVPRVGPFEDNDVFAIVNAIPAMGLCAYGFLTPNVGGGEPCADAHKPMDSLLLTALPLHRHMLPAV